MKTKRKPGRFLGFSNHETYEVWVELCTGASHEHWLERASVIFSETGDQIEIVLRLKSEIAVASYETFDKMRKLHHFLPPTMIGLLRVGLSRVKWQEIAEEITYELFI
jgi:hypothetical protein